MKLTEIIAAAAIAIAGSAHAQSVSFDDFMATVESRQSELERFRDILNAPNPDRRLAALEFMIVSGDPVLSRMAREAAFSSVDETMQTFALAAYLRSGPNLRLTFEATSQASWFWEYLRELGGGTDGEIGTLNLAVGDLDEEKNCFIVRGGDQCAVALSGRGMTVFLRLGSSGLRFTDEGLLAGPISLSSNGSGSAAADGRVYLNPLD